MGVGVDDKANKVIEDPAHWSGGMPEEPDWESYDQMSFVQIINAEIARRTADPRWAESWTELSSRGLDIELAWIKRASRSR